MLKLSKRSSQNTRISRFAWLAFSTIVASALLSCTTSPTGRSQFTLFSADQLEKMGIQSFDELKQNQTIEDDRAINRYVRCVADAVAREVGERDWEVVVFRDDSANAFALPGGKIGVHTGLLDVAENQHQLAAVLGHEVGHVLANHSNERVSQKMATQIGMVAADAALGAKGVGSRGAIMQAFGLGAQYGVLLPYSRTHESEADVIGLELMARAGFDPRQSVDLWVNMKNAGGATAPELLSTHPAPDTRINDLQARMGSALPLYEQAGAQGKNPRCERAT